MRSGFTLIEMIVVLTLMSIIMGCGIISVRFYKSVKNKVDADYYCNATVGFINNSKMYCRENSCDATVTFDIERNKINLESGLNTIKTLTFSNKITLYKVEGRRINKNIEIDMYGFTNDACTIILRDNNLLDHEITMRVGTSYVKINK